MVEQNGHIRHQMRSSSEHETMTVRHRASPRRRRYRPGNSASTVGALDVPLPVASVIDGIWKSRRKIHRTPQRLATLVDPSADEEDTSAIMICIAGDQFIVVANNLNSLCVYQITANVSDDIPLKPWAVVSLTENDDNHHSTIVSLIALPFGQSLIYGETCRKEEGHVVAFTDDGQGFIVRLHKDDGASKIYDFTTMNFGVTCASVIPALKGSQDCRLLVGYQSGYLENWKIVRLGSDKTMAKLVWRGIYPNNFSIQSVMPLNIAPKEDENGDNKDNIPENKQKIELPKREKPEIMMGGTEDVTPRYLLVTLLSPTEILRTDAMVEVIDVGSLPTAWKNQTLEGSFGHLRAVNLDKCWVLPHPGMEILNSSTISTSDDPSLPRRMHFVPSQATGSMCDLPHGNGIALADGTVALLSAEEKEGELRWGIANDFNQMLLAYPSIACACLQWSTSKQNPSIPHAALCLRGGSTYLVPFVAPGDNSNIGDFTTVTVFSPDCEVDTRYVKSFAAGNLICVPDGSAQKEQEEASNHNNEETPVEPAKIPVLIYGWACGTINIYCCKLLEDRKSCRAMIGHRERSCLEELVSNGSVRILRELLRALQDSDPLLQQPMWTEARIECLQQETNLEEINVEDLLQSHHSSLRALLLLMSLNSPTFSEPKE